MSSSPPSAPPEGFDKTTLTDLELAWQERRKEAEALEQAGFHSTAAALRLYSLEILVKVVICKHLGVTYLPKVCKSHDLGSLLIHTGRWKDLQTTPPTMLRAHWDILANHSRARLNDLRYQPQSELPLSDASMIKEAFDGPENNREDGVATWLSKHI